MFRAFLSCVTSVAVVLGTMPAPLPAQPVPVPAPGAATPVQPGDSEQFSAAQLEALLAPIAL
jgi:hypothetical protein